MIWIPKKKSFRFPMGAMRLLAVSVCFMSPLNGQTPLPVVNRPAEIVWGSYRNNEALVDAGASQWTFVRENMDAYLLHGAYWNQATNTIGSPSPDIVGPKLATLLAAAGNKNVMLEHTLSGDYPSIDSAIGSAYAGNVVDPAAFGSAIANIKRLQGYGFPQPDISTDYIMTTWQEAVRWHPEWTSKEFFTALTGNWEDYSGSGFDSSPGSSDRTRYGWFRQWVERLATAFPGIRVTSTNSPVYFNWDEAGVNRRELGGSFNNFFTWLKLERRGDTVTALYSGDGSGWAELGSTTVPLGVSPRAGLFVSSLNPARLAQGRFDNVRALPFFTTDIGNPGRGGNVSVSGSTYTLTSRGNDFIHPGNNTADAQFYAYREWSGDGTFTIRLDSLVNSNTVRTNPAGEIASAGLTLRESTAPGAKQVSLLANFANQLEFLARSSANGGLAPVSGSGSPLANLGVNSSPRWLRLTRSGNSISAAHSPDGLAWTTLGTAVVSLPTAIKVGIFADSQVRFETATAVLSNVSFFTPISTSFSGTDVGTAGTGATSSVSGSTYTMKAAGTGEAGTTDALRLHSTAFTGDGTLIARLSYFADEVSPATSLAAGAQLGVTLRADTSAASAHASILFTPQLGLRMLGRTSASGATNEVATYGAGEVSIQPLGSNYRPLLHYFTGNDFMQGLNGAFPGAFSGNFAGFTSDSPYGDYQKWGGSETNADAVKHRRKIILYEDWLHQHGREHHFIANSTGSDFSGFNTTTQVGRDAWDLLYKQQSLRSIQLHQLEGGRPDKVYFESWYDGPFTMVPETQNGTFTNLVRDGIRYLKGTGQILDLSVKPPDAAGFSGEGIQQTAPAGAQLIAISTAEMGKPKTTTVRLTNLGDVAALPVLHAFETGGTGWTSTYSLGGTDITGGITSSDGLSVTDAPLYSGNELIAPGASVDLSVTVTPTAATLKRRILIRAFWNPQDTSVSVRDSVSLEFAPPAQLLVNGDLENGTNGWISNAGGSISAETTIIRSGAGAIRGNRTQTYQGPGQSLLGRLIPGQTYQLSAWVRTGSATPATVKATFAYTGTSGGTSFTGMPTVTANDSAWVQVQGYFRYLEPNGPAISLTLYFEGPPAGVPLYVDDASLVLIPPVWTKTTTGSTLYWSTGNNWQTGNIPASASLTNAAFFPGQTLPAGTITAQQNLASPFQLNSLCFSGNSPASGSSVVVITGSPIELMTHDGLAPRLQLEAVESAPGTLDYQVSTPVTVSSDLTVSGDGSAGFTLAAAVSGPGALIKSGTSTLALETANSYAGGTRHLAGTLFLGSDTALGSGTLSLEGGSLASLPSKSPVLDNPLVLAADLDLTGDLMFTGPAFIQNGNRRLDIPAGTVTLGGIISDDVSRNLLKSGTGTLVIAGANTYRGTTVIQNGPLRISHPTALGSSASKVYLPGGNVLASLELDGGIAFSRPVELAMHNTVGHAQLVSHSGNNVFNAGLSLNGGGARWEITSRNGTISFTGPVSNVVTGTDTWRRLYLNGPGAGSFDGAMTDSTGGTSKLGITVQSGNWSLTGAPKTYTGSTVVAGGTLDVDAALNSAITIQAGGTFSGSGSSSGNLTVQTGASALVSLLNWNLPPAPFSASQLVASGASAWTVKLDATGITGFSESARTIPMVSAGGLVDVNPAAIGLVVTGFPGTGSWSINTAGNTLSFVYQPDLYAAWASTIPWNGKDPAPLADPDSDGLVNLLEYALARNPLVSGEAPAISAELVSKRLRLTFERIADPALHYEVLGSDDLAPPSAEWDVIWSSTGVVNVAGLVAVDDAVIVPLPKRRFMRLRVSR